MHAKTVQDKLCFRYTNTGIKTSGFYVLNPFNATGLSLYPRNIRKSYEMGFGDHVTSLSFLKKNKIY